MNHSANRLERIICGFSLYTSLYSTPFLLVDSVVVVVVVAHFFLANDHTTRLLLYRFTLTYILGGLSLSAYVWSLLITPLSSALSLAVLLVVVVVFALLNLPYRAPGSHAQYNTHSYGPRQGKRDASTTTTTTTATFMLAIAQLTLAELIAHTFTHIHTLTHVFPYVTRHISKHHIY